MESKKQVVIHLDTWALTMNDFHLTIRYLNRILKSIPKEHREEAVIEASLFEEYGEPAVEFEVRYSRPYTEDEMATLKKQADAAVRFRKAQLRRELAELEANDPD